METITVKKLVGRKVIQGSSGPFTNTTIQDVKGRTISAAGTWAEGWVEGGSYDVSEIAKNFSKDGTKVFLNAKRPITEGRKATGSYSNYKSAAQPQNTTFLAYQLAIQFASIQYVGKKAPKLNTLDEVAEHFKSKLEVATTPIQKQDDVPTVELNKEETTVKTPEVVEDVPADEEDEDIPF